jgi:hypothetical protein
MGIPFSVGSSYSDVVPRLLWECVAISTAALIGGVVAISLDTPAHSPQVISAGDATVRGSSVVSTVTASEATATAATEPDDSGPPGPPSPAPPPSPAQGEPVQTVPGTYGPIYPDGISEPSPTTITAPALNPRTMDGTPVPLYLVINGDHYDYPLICQVLGIERGATIYLVEPTATITC